MGKGVWDPRRRPPAHLLEKTPVYRYPLDHDGCVFLLQQLEQYNTRIYWFCLTLVVITNSGADLHVERVDTCHGEVHRHRFCGSGNKEEKIGICGFEPGDHKLLEIEHDRAYEDYLVTWSTRIADWRRR